MRRLILLLAITASMSGMLFTASASAQVVPSSLVGERVRVTVPRGLEPLTGRVLRIEEGFLVLEGEAGGPTQVTLSDIERLELSLGQRRNVGRGAWIGALVGAGAGALLGAAIFAGDSGVDIIDQVSAAEGAGALAVGGVAAGTLVGVAFGYMSKSERWTDVPRQRWSLSLGVQRGVQVGLRFAL